MDFIRQYVLLFRLYRAVKDGNAKFIAWAVQDIDNHLRTEQIGRAA